MAWGKAGEPGVAPGLGDVGVCATKRGPNRCAGVKVVVRPGGCTGSLLGACGRPGEPWLGWACGGRYALLLIMYHSRIESPESTFFTASAAVAILRPSHSATSGAFDNTRGPLSVRETWAFEQGWGLG